MKMNRITAVSFFLFGVILASDAAKAQLDITPEELAVPPIGEVQTLYLRDVGFVHTWLSNALAGVPPGPEGQGSPWFAKFQTFNTGLATVTSSKLQSDCFNLIPHMAELLTVFGEGEGVDKTIDRAGVMILNPTAVLAKLESIPGENATFFLNKSTAAEVFARYETGGDGLPELKTKYAANKTEIIAKWNELALWVSQHPSP